MNNEISLKELDMLREISNIGAGNGATSLSLLLNKRVDINVQTPELYNVSKLNLSFKNSTKDDYNVLFEISSDLKGYILFLIDTKGINTISDIVAKDYKIDNKTVISEIANILSGAYITAIATLINGKILLSPPKELNSCSESFTWQFINSKELNTNKIMSLSSNLTIENKNVSVTSVLLLENQSLEKLIKFFYKELD